MIAADRRYEIDPLPGEPPIRSIDVRGVAAKTVAPVPAVDQNIGRDDTEFLVLSVAVTDNDNPYEAYTRESSRGRTARRG